MFDNTGWVLIFAVLISLIPAAIAKRKGYSFVGWWAYGAALWIVAFPHSLLLRVNRNELDRRNYEAGLRRCPACMEWIQGPAKICRYCGATVVVGDLPPAAATVAEPPAGLPTPGLQSVESSRSGNPRTKVIMAAVIGLLGIASIAGSRNPVNSTMSVSARPHRSPLRPSY
jgi:hypothetical protein